MTISGNRTPEAGPCFSIPQTNLQLYRVMRERGHGENALRQANAAWLLAAENTTGMFRGSGKPFCCHLAGVAGLLCQAGMDVPVIVAGLLHAMYQDRVPFKGLALAERRERIARHFGETCERLVYEYHGFEVERLDGWEDTALRKKGDVVLMRVADELEDMLDDAISVHGRPGDDDTAPGGAAARRRKSLDLGPELLRVGHLFQNEFFIRQLEYWLERIESAAAPSPARTGRYSSYSYGGEGSRS